MADPPRYRDTEGDAGRSPEQGAGGGTRRRVFVLGIIVVIVLVGLMVFLHLTGTLGPGVH